MEAWTVSGECAGCAHINKGVAVPEKPDVKIWRVYNDGTVKNETHVLWNHISGAGYNGNVGHWSEENKKYRFGCAQIVQYGNQEPEVLYEGYLNEMRLLPIITKLPGRSHTLCQPGDFTNQEYFEDIGVARLVIDGGLGICKNCGAGESELEDYQTCDAYRGRKGP